jgi:hypothetical protein
VSRYDGAEGEGGFDSGGEDGGGEDVAVVAAGGESGGVEDDGAASPQAAIVSSAADARMEQTMFFKLRIFCFLLLILIIKICGECVPV